MKSSYYNRFELDLLMLELTMSIGVLLHKFFDVFELGSAPTSIYGKPIIPLFPAPKNGCQNP